MKYNLLIAFKDKAEVGEEHLAVERRIHLIELVEGAIKTMLHRLASKKLHAANHERREILGGQLLLQQLSTK